MKKLLSHIAQHIALYQGILALLLLLNAVLLLWRPLICLLVLRYGTAVLCLLLAGLNLFFLLRDNITGRR